MARSIEDSIDFTARGHKKNRSFSLLTIIIISFLPCQSLFARRRSGKRHPGSTGTPVSAGGLETFTVYSNFSCHGFVQVVY
ncbi:MAG: hypothetical protein IKH34_02890 [Oscillospiraceae bacterium]|nr:hypothetical protein [Oscillospiraceae bacterium]